MQNLFLEQLIDLALAEDIGGGDITTQSCIPKDTMAEGRIRAKAPTVIAGLEVARRVFEKVDPKIEFNAVVQNGDALNKGDDVLFLKGAAHSLLIGERVALNFLMRLSGIAQMSRVMSDALKGTNTRVVDTRKTTPGWRHIEKAAVRAGGATNHRGSLFDGVMIKENHIASAGGIALAVERAREHAHHLMKIEVETTNLKEVQEALDAKADVIMLDNMNNALTKEAVDLIRAFEKRSHHRVTVEASGNMVLDRLASVAACGVDVISMGALTHSAVGADLSMKVKLPSMKDFPS